MDVEPEGGEGGNATVVVESGGGAPQYATSNEVAALIEACETRVRADLDQRFTSVHERLASVEDRAWQAQGAATDAQIDADIALEVAEAALEEAGDGGEGEGGGTGEGAKVDEEDSGPKAPEKKEAAPAKERRSGWRDRLFPEG